jgi:SAM-dependent methyltransferase
MYNKDNRLQRENITEEVRAFYEHFPFPGYEDTDSPATLVERARRGIYTQLIDTQIPFGARVLDFGCGTGQLVNFLALGGRLVVGCDLSSASLEKAIKFQQKFAIKNASFVKGDLFTIYFKETSFDYILCNGVLHHTGDPYCGFKRLCQWLKPDGYIVIGIYNRWGRKMLQVRRFLGKLNRMFVVNFDRHFRRKDLSDEWKTIWLMDQYHHPYESTHTVGEVLLWFKENNIQYCNSIPKITFGQRFDKEDRLFVVHNAGGKFQHFLKQLLWMFTQDNEGGYFLIIGKKQNNYEKET